MLQVVVLPQHGMDAGLGRTVLVRDRFARSWGLGDRRSPAATTPALVLTEGDPDLDPVLAPFTSSSSRRLPSVLTVAARLPFAPPSFEREGPAWEVSVGHVLPPEMEEANAGEVAGTGPLLPVSWQRMRHDEALMDVDLDPALVVLTDAVALASRPARLVEAITTLKQRFPGALLWTPGLGGPDNLALLVWLGVDLFDLARSTRASAAGALLDRGGPRLPDQALGEDASIDAQVVAWTHALAEVRQHLMMGSLRTVVDRQAMVAPSTVAQLRHHDAFVSELPGVRSVVVDAGKRLLCMSEATLNDPSVVAWERFMRGTYRAPEGLDRILVLLPCSARKPYRSSPSHRRFIEAIGTNAVHEVMVTSPLGLVPRDLEQVWPAANYDLAVTGRWSGDEVARVERMLRDLVTSHGYVAIVDHSGLELPADVYGNLPRVDTRCGEAAGASTSLERLGDAVREAIRTHGARRRSKDAMLMDEWKSVSRLHFGSDAWLTDAEVRGRPPRYRLMQGGEQVAQWSPERASLALSKASVPLLAEGAGLARVHLVPGVVWKGDLHRGIVEHVEGEVLGGADVLVLQDDRPVGLARALAPGWEWSGTPGRLAKAHQRL